MMLINPQGGVQTVTPEMYGAIADGITNDTVAFQKAINSGNAVSLSGKTYLVDTLVLKNGTCIKGSSDHTSIIKASVSAQAALFTLDVGQIQQLTLRDFTVIGQGPSNPGQHCFNLVSQKSLVTNNGGIWYSVWQSISVRGFDGDSLRLIGGSADFTMAHQFISMTMVDIERPLHTSGYALFCTGQVEHVTFNTCRFDGNGNGIEPIGGNNVYMGRAWTGGTPGSGAPVSDIRPNDIKFLDSTTQAAALGILIDRCENISFDSHWFEQLNQSVTWQNTASGMFVNCRFVNAGLTGYGVEVDSSSQVAFDTTNEFNGTFASDLIRSNSAGVYVGGQMLGVNVNLMTGVIPDTTYNAGNQIDAFSNRGLLLNVPTPGLTCTVLTSNLPPGEIIAITSKVGSQAFNIGTGGGSYGNFNLGIGVANITINPTETAFFMRMGPNGAWHFIAKN